MHFLYALTRHGKLIASLQGNIISFKVRPRRRLKQFAKNTIFRYPTNQGRYYM